MKKLENYGVQELSIKEQKEIDGGWTVTRKVRNNEGTYDTVVTYYRWNNGVVESYLTCINGKFGSPAYE